MTVELRSITILAPVRQTIIDLYAEVRAELLHLPNYRIDAFSERLNRHSGESGWQAVIGYDDGTPVGYAYANTVEPGDRWWKRMDPPAPEQYSRTAAVALKEIMVRVPWRGTGTARRIHDELLCDRAEPYVSLLVNPEAGDGKVRALYESWGYRQISRQQPSPGSPVLAAMVRDRQ
ncbi:GNAT family N-acetyltransferase [Streptomyces sp. H27-D2]|uniref:GNAT family N-acetyltransferase n=1 Tax=Streptomyces sp. H27-D2 TaxID=3046304 RepID=UPI002DBD8448|nr:GNAT family N-acetyltransferase [Streptomyces sp. H27-D2]MEC4015073.1 GNAT family N-acetyltransferase [Streptomyces sp. H27-D2]